MANKYIQEGKDGYTIFSGLPEFGYELVAIIPYCYYLHTQGKLRKTISCYDTRCFYFFSEKHEEVNEKRRWSNTKDLRKNLFPNISMHSPELDWEKFLPPPFKEFYKPKAIKFAKPTVVINNRISKEWDGDPVNYLSKEYLEKIITILSPQYQIVLINAHQFSKEYGDHQDTYDLALDKNFKIKNKVLEINDLRASFPDFTINELQCRIYAGCEKFISSNGGNGILSSYFGGENIIFTKMCREIDPDVNSFNLWYNRLSNANISVVHSEEQLLNLIESKWIRKDTLFNILIRTSKRKNYFHDCIDSVLSQNYDNINIIVSVDNDESFEYARKYPVNIVRIKKEFKNISPPDPNDDAYGKYFKYNEYFNEMAERVPRGYVIYLDDDDKFLDSDALKKLDKIIKKENADVIFWRVQFPKRIVPSDENWAKKTPVCCDMSTIGFCFKSELKPLWEPFKRGDFRVARFLANHGQNVVWHNEILTTLQRKKADGWGKQDDKESLYVVENPEINIIVTAYQAEKNLKLCLDSIYQNLKNQKDLKYNVWIGVDGCQSTFLCAKKLTRSYPANFHFFLSRENHGTYFLKNSLAKKITMRNSLLMFFDSDDIMPVNFIKLYYDYYKSLPKNDDFIINTYCFGMYDEILSKITNELKCISLNDIKAKLQRDDIQSALNYAFQICLKPDSPVKSSLFLHQLYRYYIVKNNILKYWEDNANALSIPDGVFISRYDIMEKMGFYYTKRVGQDTNFLARAEKQGIKRIEGLFYCPFIRRMSDISLTKSDEYGRASAYREEVKLFNQQVIENNKLIAPWESIDLIPIL